MFFPLLSEKRTSFFHQRYFFLDCLHGMFHNFCLLTSEKRPPFALVLKTQNILKTVQKQSLNMRSAEISEKFSVTLWHVCTTATLQNNNLTNFPHPQDKTKSLCTKKQFVDNFFIGLGAFAPLPSATPYPEGKKKGTCFCRYLIGCVRSPAICHKSRGAALFFCSRPSGYTSWLSLRSAEEPFHRAWGFRPVAFGNSIPRRQKERYLFFAGTLLCCAS